MNKNDNNSESNIINHYIDYENMEIGHAYIMQLKTGAIISGGLVLKYEFLDVNCAEIIRAYTFMLTNSKTIDFKESEIETIDLIQHYNENHKSVLQYLEEFQKRHKVKCFDDKGERLSNSTILGEVVIGKKIWDEMSEEEKKEFIEKLRMTSDEITEIVDICTKTLKENNRLHDARLRMLDESVRLMDRYKEVQDKYQNINKIYEVFFDDLRIIDFLRVI